MYFLHMTRCLINRSILISLGTEFLLIVASVFNTSLELEISFSMFSLMFDGNLRSTVLIPERDSSIPYFTKIVMFLHHFSSCFRNYFYVQENVFVHLSLAYFSAVLWGFTRHVCQSEDLMLLIFSWGYESERLSCQLW